MALAIFLLSQAPFFRLEIVDYRLVEPFTLLYIAQPYELQAKNINNSIVKPPASV